MPDTQTYAGGCHCGAVRYHVDLKLDAAVSCNCSICSKTGTLLAFAPAAQFRLEQGEDAVTDYQFGKRRIHHLFCTRCGVRSFSRAALPDGTPMVAVNVRCLEGVDPSTLAVKAHDGRSIPID